MSIFKKRMMRPNQLAVLRELESRVSMGKVLYCQDGLAIISGLNNDAPLGTKLAFVSGAVGALLWHRSDSLVYALVLGGAADICVGEAVECRIKGVLQVVDDVKGPVTRKDFDLVMSPAEETAGVCFGKVVDYLGRPSTSDVGTGDAPSSTERVTSNSRSSSSSNSSGRSGGASSADLAFLASSSSPHLPRCRPLLNVQVAMKNRGQITESLLTGVKAVDVLTPVGRGASMLVIGPATSGKTTLATDTVLGQRNTGVKTIYAAVSQTREAVAALRATLQAGGVLSQTCIVASAPDALLGERYAALCTACAIGERVRDEGGHALVVVDDLRPLLDTWENLVAALIQLGEDKMRAGLIKDSNGRDIELAPQTDEELVEQEGMLVTGAVAQRRGFFSTLFQRAAKLERAGGGGSLSMLLLIPGCPATGVTKVVDMSKYQTLTPRQREQIQAVLQKRLADAEAEGASQGGAGAMRTEAVEEFISIADGQVVLEPRTSPDDPYVMNPKLSITRIGTRAYYKALESLAAQVRLDLTQAEDARRFHLGGAKDPVVERFDARARRLTAVLLQQAGQPAALEDQVVLLFAVQNGFADSVAPEAAGGFMADALRFVRATAPEALQELSTTHILTATAEKGIRAALAAFLRLDKHQQNSAA